VLAAMVLLIALIVRWVTWGPFSPSRSIVGAILTLPLIVAAPLLYSGHRRTYLWTTLAVIPSLVLATTEAVADSALRVWAGLCLCTALVLFGLLIVYLRASRAEPESG
jgi:uncharacterized membrane protein